MSRSVAKGRECVRLSATVFLTLFLLGVTMILTGCNWLESIRPAPLKVDPVVKIGLVAPFEGRHRDVGYDVIYSARLAVRQANENKEPGDIRLALVALDDFGDPVMARESAAAMVADPGIVAVIGHWLPETTEAAKLIYETEGLPFVPAGSGMLGMAEPSELDDEFLKAYAEVTPFDEVAGPYAGPAYDGVQFIIMALTAAEDEGHGIDRAAVNRALDTVAYDGLTGTIFAP